MWIWHVSFSVNNPIRHHCESALTSQFHLLLLFSAHQRRLGEKNMNMASTLMSARLHFLSLPPLPLPFGSWEKSRVTHGGQKRRLPSGTACVSSSPFLASFLSDVILGERCRFRSSRMKVMATEWLHRLRVSKISANYRSCYICICGACTFWRFLLFFVVGVFNYILFTGLSEYHKLQSNLEGQYYVTLRSTSC